MWLSKIVFVLSVIYFFSFSAVTLNSSASIRFYNDRYSSLEILTKLHMLPNTDWHDDFISGFVTASTAFRIACFACWKLQFHCFHKAVRYLSIIFCNPPRSFGNPCHLILNMSIFLNKLVPHHRYFSVSENPVLLR